MPDNSRSPTPVQFAAAGLRGHLRQAPLRVVTTNLKLPSCLAPFISSSMTTKILILDPHAEIYRDRLHADFPALQFSLAHKASELPVDLSDIDVLISFGIELKDEFYQRATRLKWVQCLATGVDHILRCPSLKGKRCSPAGAAFTARRCARPSSFS
jgi:D-isomer specific 2-hydroxyacid dehydrogenase, catalytic domain